MPYQQKTYGAFCFRVSIVESVSYATRCKLGPTVCFLAAQDSSIGKLVTDWVSETPFFLAFSDYSDYNDYNYYNDYNNYNDYIDYNDYND